MSKTKLYTFNDSFQSKIAKEYKVCRLLTKDGDLLCPYNHNKLAIKEKIKEISRRLAYLPDGVYTLQCLYNQNRAVQPDTYFLKKGEVTLFGGG